VDVQADAASKAGTSPQDEARGAFAFAGLVFDLDACILRRESGEAIALTRGEFALLREFARRPGRVLSRDFLLDAAVGRRNAPFDRSVDVMVGRLRKKVEPNPKQPSIIQTVPGEGYRFTAPLYPYRPAPGPAASADAPAPDPTPSPASAPAVPAWRAYWPVLAAAVALCLIAAVAAIQWRPLRQESGPRLSIVVLPFENMSGDKEQDYFADGITDDLTTDLSHLQDSFVISRGTAFTFKGKPIDAKTIGRELGVRYLLEGSVRRLGEKVEIDAQLISTATGAHVWADRFEGERKKLGEMQVDVVGRLANSLGVELVKAEALRSMRERPSNPDAVDLAMRGEAILNSNPDKPALQDALTLFERALALDPQNVRAMIGLATCLTWRANLYWSDDRASDIARADETIDRALTLEPTSSSAHNEKGFVFEAKKQWSPAIAEAEAAIAEDSSNASAHATAGFRKLFLGRGEDGFPGVETALRLSPRDPQAPWWQFDMCALHADLAHWEQAIPWCDKAVAGLPQVFLPLVSLAAANAWAGHDKEAKDAVAQLQQVYPGFTLQTWASMRWSDDPTFNARHQLITEGLRKAGLPEGETKKEDWLAAAPGLSIVVLPFENMSGDKEQDYFADGITDDLTTDLSHLQDSFVISRGTAFTFKGKPIDAKQIGRELGVRYVLEGSVRRLGENVEVNAQLISTETGSHVWADRFEGERSKLGELQVDVVSRLANSLGVELAKAEALRSTRERPGNPDAADLAMQAQVKRDLPDSKATRNEAVALAERALVLDPQNVRALTVLAAALLDRVGDQWSDDPAGDIARAEKASETAWALQPENSSVHYVKGYLYMTKQQWGPSITEFETATALDPNNAKAYADASFDRLFLGRAEDSFAGVETALRLSPRDPELPWWQFYMCVFHAQLAQREQAIPWCSKSAAGQPEVFYPLADLAAAYAWLGRDKEAKDAAAQLQKVYPGFTVQTWAGIHRHFSGDSTFNARFQLTVDGLRKAGIPEGEKAN
jgi:TolB-like protein/DNA-binding winged helix-turn-helix (wHTH) protein/Flp pilus assembly protein TadD